MRALFLTDGIDAPGSRYRAEQFFPWLEAHGVNCVLAPAYGRAYNRVHARPLVGRAYRLACRLKRAAQTLASARYDVVFLQRTALPQTALPELLRARYGSPLVFDFDDSIWLGPHGRPSRARERAFRDAVSVADHVVAGNEWLAERAGVPAKTTMIPTVVDADCYAPGPSEDRVPGEVVVGWMGTATNFPAVRSALPGILAAVEAIPRARLRIVSNDRFRELDGHPRVEQIRWTAAREVSLLRSFDLGLMPLEDTALNHGKCSFKMIQYMSVGCPVVASAVGANVPVFEGSEAGRLVPPGASFEEPIRALAADAGARERAGRGGRAQVLARYSLPPAAASYLAIFEALAGVPRAPA